MIRQIPINGFDSNFSYFIIDDESKEIAVVDPGDVHHLVEEITEDGLIVKKILLTHSHADHTEGLHEMIKKYGVPVFMHENARGKVDIQEEMMVFVDEGDSIKVGGLKVDVLYTPGHIDDALCFKVGRDLITGDTLFVEGCGRADLPGSDVKALYKSLQRIKRMADDTIIHPGHDYGSKRQSTIAWEKQHNRYFKCRNFEDFKALRLPDSVS